MTCCWGTTLDDYEDAYNSHSLMTCVKQRDFRADNFKLSPSGDEENFFLQYVEGSENARVKLGTKEKAGKAKAVAFVRANLTMTGEELSKALADMGISYSVSSCRNMWHGDRSRKQNLIDYGFRLPSALDNRPLRFEEFESRTGQIVYVSATPGPYELTKSAGVVVEQIIRPTGLIDPVVEIRPVKGQIDDLLAEIRDRAERNQRVLVTTLTKRMAQFAIAQGVPASDVLEEPQAQNTVQNIFYSAQILHRHGWSSAEVVSSPHHLGRAALILLAFNQRQPSLSLDWSTHAAPWPPEYGVHYKLIFYSVEAWRCLELRLRGFPPSRFLPAHA